MSHPTPPSGMPAAVAATSIARPSREGDEIVASPRPRSEGEEILAALHELRGEVTTRFEAVERTQAQQGDTLKHLGSQVAENTKNISDQATALTNIARASSAAAELAAQALAKVNTSQDEARKMVESAMAIQKGAIETAVRDVVAPLAEKVEHLEQSDEQQSTMLTQSNEALGAVVDELGIEDRVALGREVKKGEHPPETALKKIDKRAKHSTLVQLVIAIGVIVNAIWQLATSHH